MQHHSFIIFAVSLSAFYLFYFTIWGVILCILGSILLLLHVMIHFGLKMILKESFYFLFCWWLSSWPPATAAHPISYTPDPSTQYSHLTHLCLSPHLNFNQSQLCRSYWPAHRRPSDTKLPNCCRKCKKLSHFVICRNTIFYCSSFWDRIRHLSFW